MAQVNPLATKPLVYEVPGTEKVVVRRDVVYAGELTMDIYEPSATPAPRPAVVIVSGYPDDGFANAVGCRFKEMTWTVSWGRMIAASGITAIAYTNREPLADLQKLFTYLRENAAALGIDPDRIGLFATSGHGPTAFSAIANESSPRLKCAAFAYAYLPGTAAEEVSGRFHFAVPPQKAAQEIPREIAMLLVRAGRDEMPRLNETLDNFVAEALAANLPLNVMNLPDAPHAFDLLDDGRATVTAIEAIVFFLKSRLIEPL